MLWSYSNVDGAAPWRNTVYQCDPPWPRGCTPSLTGISGFHIRMISIDVLHAWHIGCGRDLAGSAIKVLASKRGFWRGRNQEIRLQSATQRLKLYCKQHGFSLTMSKLSKTSVTWKTDCYPEVRCKGYDTFLILRWLASEVQLQDCGDDRLATVLWASDAFFNLVTKCGYFETPLEEQNRLTLGAIMVNTYVSLAADAVQRKQFLYRLRPKFHLVCHIASDVRASKMNVNAMSTWMDEDAVKRWMRLKKMVHRKTASESVLRRFLLGLRANLNRGLRLMGAE